MIDMTRLSVCLVLVGMLSGCGLANQVASQQEWKRFELAIQECDRQFPHKTQRPVMPRVRCLDGAWEAHAMQAAPRDRDLLKRFMASRLILAERYDRGDLTEAQFIAGINVAQADMIEMVSQRDAVAHEQTRAAIAAVGQGLREWGNSQSPPPVYRPISTPTRTECRTIGNSTECTTY